MDGFVHGPAVFFSDENVGSILSTATPQTACYGQLVHSFRRKLPSRFSGTY
jgi:hypothetical protein